MEEYSGTYYEISAPNMSCGLYWKFETVEEAKEHIKKEHSRAKENGYDPKEEWLIIKVSWNRMFTDNGYFVCENESRYAVCHCDDHGDDL